METSGAVAAAPRREVTVSSFIDEDISESIRDVLTKAVQRVHGLQAVSVSSCFGLPIVRAVAADAPVETVTIAETVFAPCFFVAFETASKLPIGEMRSLLVDFKEVTLLHATLAPLSLCLVAHKRTDAEALQTVAAELVAALGPMKAAAEMLTSRRDDE